MLKSKEKGVVLVAVAVFTVILTILGFSVLIVANSEISQARNDINKTKAFYLAEAGVARLSANASSGNFANIGQTTLGQGSYRVDIDNTNWTEPNAVATGRLGGEEERVQVTISYLYPPYECGIYAGGLGGSGWSLMLRGTGDPCIVYSGGNSVGDVNGKDIITGNVFANSDVALYEQGRVDAPSPNPYNIRGDVNVTGSISVNDSASIAGQRITGSDPMSPPNLAAMNYAVNNTHNVSALCEGQSIDSRGRLPNGHPLRDIFRKNPTFDRSVECGSTAGDDYFLEPTTFPGGGGSWNTAPTPLNVGTDRVYYIDGNLWVHSKSDTFGFNMQGKVTIVVTGNIYICDNLKYADPNRDMLGLVALGKYDSYSGERISGGDIIFGDPTYGTMYTMSAMMFAAHDFLYNSRTLGTFGGEPKSGFIINGSMAALNKVSLERDWYTNASGTRRPARYDRSTGLWYDSGTAVALTSGQVATMKHYRMRLNYDARVRSTSTQPPGLPRGMGRIFCGLGNWKALP